VRDPDGTKEPHALLVNPEREELHRPVEGPRDEARVAVHEGPAVGEAVEHGERVVLGEGQEEDGPLTAREPP
jgi:hypothetical protein